MRTRTKTKKTTTKKTKKTTSKKTSSIVEAAKWAKKHGYEYIYSITGRHYTPEFVRAVKVDEILKKGKWITDAHTKHKTVPHKAIALNAAKLMIKKHKK
jgi:hypothetical protein